MRLGPVIRQASPVTLKMPAPMRMPSSVAYDSIVPRSRRRPEVIWASVQGNSVFALQRCEFVQRLLFVAGRTGPSSDQHLEINRIDGPVAVQIDTTELRVVRKAVIIRVLVQIVVNRV